MALFSFGVTTAFAVASSEEFTASLHTVDQLLLRWQKNPDEWNQLLLEVFGRSALLEINGIMIEILNGQAVAGIFSSYTHRLRQIVMNVSKLTITGLQREAPRQSKLFCARNLAML